MKPYKALSPYETINSIRDLLSQVGVFLKEATFSQEGQFYTTRINISSNRLERLNIGTNGKGTTYPYALASGYAEFMERLQNYLLFKGYRNAIKRNVESLVPFSLYKKRLIEEELILDFLYDPREIEMTVEDELSNHLDTYIQLFPFLINFDDALHFFKNELNFQKVVCIPYYSHSLRKEVFLAHELVLISCGSNGMASGNTKDEALIQGFCELFERYAGYEIYRKNITPPTIPLEEFSGKPIYDSILRLKEKTQFKIIIKDCSLGLGIPTLGVLVIDEDRGKYNFNLGSALNPDIALERCLTELYQSAEGLIWYDIQFEQYSNNSKYSEDYVFINGNKLFNDSSGYWPVSLFKETPSYKFEGLNYELNHSDNEDLAYIKNKVKELGFEIFIRDVSFFGFNSYYIVVPGMSQYPDKKEHYKTLSDAYSCLHALRDIKGKSQEEIQKICDNINKEYSNILHSKFDFQQLMVYHVNEDILDLDMELLLFMLNYRVSNLREAYFYINEFIKNKDFYTYKYYHGIKDYIKLKIQDYNDKDIIDSLKLLYNEEVFEIVEDLKEPSKIFQHYEWSSCFNCENCEITEDCRQFDFLKMMKTLQNKQQERIIDHNDFKL